MGGLLLSTQVTEDGGLNWVCGHVDGEVEGPRSHSRGTLNPIFGERNRLPTDSTNTHTMVFYCGQGLSPAHLNGLATLDTTSIINAHVHAGTHTHSVS